MQTSTRDPAPEIPIQLEDLPDEIHGKILSSLQEKTWASAVKNLVERERIKLENSEEPITVGRPVTKRKFFGGYYTQYIPVTFQDLKHIRERLETLNNLTPDEAYARGLRTPESIQSARDTLTYAESKINYREFLRTRNIQLQLERDVKKANYLEHLLKKSY